MMSNDIWDLQHPKGQDPLGRSAFERLENLAAIVTFGCNIPLFTFAYDPVESINFPGKNLPEPVRCLAR